MKKTYFLLIIPLLFGPLGGKAQCPIQNTHTDPDPNFVQPQGSGFKTNTFEWWMNPVAPINKQNTPPAVISPYWSGDSYMDAIARQDKSDYSPRNGWELIKQDMGYYYNKNAAPAWAGYTFGPSTRLTGTIRT